MDNPFSFLNETLARIENKLGEIDCYFQKQVKNEPQSQTDHWFDLPALCHYIPDKPAKPTVYGWITRNEIPYHKRGKNFTS